MPVICCCSSSRCGGVHCHAPYADRGGYHHKQVSDRIGRRIDRRVILRAPLLGGWVLVRAWLGHPCSFSF